MRRLRASAGLRGMVRETDVRAGQLVLPLFVSAEQGAQAREPIATMPGVERLSLTELLTEAHEAEALGLAAVMLFGIPAAKDDHGSGAWDEDGVVQLAVRAIKQACPQLLVLTDVCLCEYTEHGHCGVLRNPVGAAEDGAVDNDATLELLARTAVSHARAGADMVAPSDMMDGRVSAIREELDCDGATMSAPARTAVSHARASSSSVASLSTAPSSRSTPQWPWSVYSHRHTSVITSSCGSACLIARVASCTTPSSSHAPDPRSSLDAGIPNSITAAIPSRATSCASATLSLSDRRSTPGIVAIGERPARAPAASCSCALTNSGSTSDPARRSVSRTRPRRPSLARSLRMRVCGNAIAPEVRWSRAH